MATIGQTLKAAREARKITTTQAAAATRIKLQQIEAMERDDFSAMAAPAYAKGFIRIYAEYLGLDPQPLVLEYVARHAPQQRPPLQPEPPARRRPETFRERLERVVVWFRKIPPGQVRKGAIAAGALIVVALVMWAWSRIERPAAPSPAPPPAAQRAASDLEIVEPPPDPYLEPGAAPARAAE